MGKAEQSRQPWCQIRSCELAQTPDRRPTTDSAQIRLEGLSQIDRHLDPCYPRNSVTTHAPTSWPIRSFQGCAACEACATLIMEGMSPSILFPPLSSPQAQPAMSSSSSLLPLLPLALKNKDLVNAERYLSGEPEPPLSTLLLDAQAYTAGVALTILVYDYMLTFGDEVRYIWRRPISNIKVLYLVLRYSVLLAELVYFQGGVPTSACVCQAQHLYSAKRFDNTPDT